MSRPPIPNPSPIRRQRGFEAASGLVKAPIRAVGEARGFVLARLLTHWPEIAGEEVAGLARPVRMTYGREGMGASLSLLVTSAHAPMLQMMLPRIKDRVNAAYGYAAVSRISLTQTTTIGFAENQAAFAGAQKAPAPDPEIERAAAAAAAVIGDAGLRAALETMGKSILNRRQPDRGKIST
jgi:hypothetical protein